MLELAEIKNIERQVNNTLIGKKVKRVFLPTIYQRFAWFYGDVNLYPQLLVDKVIHKAKGHGLYIDLYLGELTLTVGEGTRLRYYDVGAKPPFKYQLGLEFTDLTRLFFTIPLSGGIWVFSKQFSNMKYERSLARNILDHDFDLGFLVYLLNDARQDCAIKHAIVNEQILPGIGFSSAQDILFLAKIQPKRLVKDLYPEEKETLFWVMKDYLENTLKAGGRKSETDLHGNHGGYEGYFQNTKTRKTCPVCGASVSKEIFEDAPMYYCAQCQK